MVKKKNTGIREFQLFGGMPQKGFEEISLVGGMNGLVSGTPTREGFGTVVRAAKATGKLGGMFFAPVTVAAKKRARGIIRKKRKEIFAKKPTTKELLEEEQQEIFGQLKKKRKEQKQKVKIRKLERQTELFGLVPFKM